MHKKNLVESFLNSSLIFIFFKLGTPPMPVSWWMDKQIVVDLYNGILASIEQIAMYL